jgi:cytolysin (calcineurin-like family phosphatase)
MDLMTFRPKKVFFPLKVLKGFTSSDVNYQTTDYFSSSALYQWNNHTLYVSHYHHFSKEYGRFIGGKEKQPSSSLLQTTILPQISLNAHTRKFPRTRLP